VEHKVHVLPPGATILVIDDEEEVREVVEEVLQSRGVHVLSAADGSAAVELFRRHGPRIDVVLLDMNMPGMSGEAVFQELVNIRPDVKILLSTGYSEQEAESRFTRSRLAGFVHKPYTASGLVEQIGAAIAP
jgi:two-component system cell cycle sensor histidine kinase/response regulator CckA